jgi:hypothetical protein
LGMREPEGESGSDCSGIQNVIIIKDEGMRIEMMSESIRVGSQRDGLNRSKMVVALVLTVSMWLNAQGLALGDDNHPDEGTVKLKIHVTAGDGNKPAANASVYVRYEENKKGKQAELDLKTNEDGTVKVPELPKGRMLIQVVAPGWKTFGKYYDLEKDEEEVTIHLENRPRWY